MMIGRRILSGFLVVALGGCGSGGQVAPEVSPDARPLSSDDAGSSATVQDRIESATPVRDPEPVSRPKTVETPAAESAADTPAVESATAAGESVEPAPVAKPKPKPKPKKKKVVKKKKKPAPKPAPVAEPESAPADTPAPVN